MKIYMIFGGVFVTLAVMIAAMVILMQPGEEDAIDRSLLVENRSMLEEAPNDIVYDAINMSALLVCVSQRELDMLSLQIEEIFTEYLPSIVTSGIDADMYYSNYTEEIHTKLGVASDDEFMDVYNKSAKRAEFDVCQVILVPSSLVIYEDGYYFDLEVLYDEMIQITYFVVLDPDDLTITLR